MKTYRLGSAEFVFTPGLIAWAINAARFKKDREEMVSVIADGWDIPRKAARALLMNEVPHRIEGDVVVFEVEG